MSKRDYYDILGITKGTSDEDLKKAYRKLAMRYHPDRNADDDKAVAETKFKEVQEAYDNLSDPQKRAMYDQYGHATPGHSTNQNPQWSHSTVNINDLFANMFGTGQNPFGDMFNNGRPQQAQQRQFLTISLEDAFKGKELRLPGNVSINVPAGVRPGTKFVVNNTIYQIEIHPHHKFKRSGDDLLIDVEISAIEAMLSVGATLDTLDGSTLQFTIPAGIQFGQVVRLAGKGMKNPETDRFGDLMIRIAITTPKALTAEQIAVLKTMQHREIFNI